MDFENLEPELQDKLKACTTEEELRALAGSVGLSLEDLQLDGISGGAECSDVICFGLGCDSFQPCMEKAQPCRSFSNPTCKIYR